MMLIPRQYEYDLYAMAETHTREGADGSISAAVRCALEHGLDPAEQRRALSGCIVAYSPDSFSDMSEREGFAEVRAGHPRAWIVYLPDTWDRNGAASRWSDDEGYRLRQKRALAHVAASAANGPQSAPRQYPLVIPQDIEAAVLVLAADWGVSPRAALNAVLELGLSGFRRLSAQQDQTA